jgi:hypothetical protein
MSTAETPAENMVDRMRRLRDAAVYAVESGDYATAEQKLLAAKIVFDTTPNTEQDGARAELRSIDSLLEQIRRRAMIAAGYTKLKRKPLERVANLTDDELAAGAFD